MNTRIGEPASGPGRDSVRAGARFRLQSELLTTVRSATGACGVSQKAVRRWLADGRLGGPPWTVEQLVSVRDAPGSRARGAKAAHGTLSRYTEGCSCDLCRTALNDWTREHERAKADTRFPESTRQQLLDELLAGQPFKAVLQDLGLTANQVWGRARRDPDWAAAFDAVLMVTRRTDLDHGSNAAYVKGCVCPECRAHQVQRMRH
jgi:hypothetical protein